MTDTSEQLGGPTQPVLNLRTVREKLWIDPEVFARVQSTVAYEEAWSCEGYVTLGISDVQAMLAALSVPIATRSTS